MILVTGATGYVGREVVAHLTDHGRPVRALVRSQHAVLPPGVELAVGDVTDPSSLRAAVGGAEAIVHLVAILDGTDEQFEAINHHGTRNLVAAAQHHGVRRFLHMSALGVDEEHAPLTRYWRTKYAAKQAVMESGLDWTIVQPSFVFGRGGGALATFERLVRLPVTPVIGDGRYRHQPVWVGDVAAAFLAALNRPQTAGQTYELGGPQVFEFNDLLDELARVTGRKPHPKLHLPAGLMKLQSAVLQHFPEPLRVTREQIVMLMAGTECDIGPMRSQLGIEPASLAEAYTR